MMVFPIRQWYCDREVVLVGAELGSAGEVGEIPGKRLDVTRWALAMPTIHAKMEKEVQTSRE